MDKVFYNGIVLNGSSVGNLECNVEKIIYCGITEFGNCYVMKFKKSKSSPNRTNFYINCYLLEEERVFKLGYIYFNLDFDRRSSGYIGTMVYDKYRGMGISTLLTSAWIQICFDNGIENLYTFANQRKPFLLYVLKKFAFEPSIITAYSDVPKVYILKRENDLSKICFFQNAELGKKFSLSSIFREDSYILMDGDDLENIGGENIINVPKNKFVISGVGSNKKFLKINEQDLEVLDSVVLYKTHRCVRGDDAYDLALKKLTR